MLPRLAAFWPGEVDETAFAAPPASGRVGGSVRRFDEGVPLFVVFRIGVVFQHAGLEVADHIDPHGVHLFKEALGIGEALMIPVKRIAEVILLTGGVTGGQPEVVNPDLLLQMFVHNLIDLLITVLFQLRIVHGGHAVAQGLLRGQNGPARKPGIASDHIAHVGPVDEKQVDVSAVGLVIAVALPVTGDLLSQVEHAVIGIVIEQAERTAVGLIHPDVEGDVLVHGVAGLWIVADGVLGAHAETPELFVKVSRLLAEAVEVILLPIHAGVMGEASQMVLFEGPLRQIAVKGLSILIE